MKLLGLDLIAFGPFTDISLDLSEGSEGVHLIYGPNEAGKSSLLRAVRQLFTEIPHLSTDDFVHESKRLRIGARVRSAGGEVLEFRRRKGRKDTLLGSDDAPLDPARLTRFLGPLNPADFVTKFAIGHEELVAGGKAIIEGRGDLGALLFAAGSGHTGIAAGQKRLQDECDELFKRGGSKPRINSTYAELEAARKLRTESTLRWSDWIEHQQALHDAQAKKQSIEQALDWARREVRRLKRLQQAIEPAAERRQLLSELAPLAGAILLAPDFMARRRDALSALEQAKISADTARRELDEVVAELESLHEPEQLLDQAEPIEDLHVRLGSHQQSARDRIQLLAESDQLEASAASLRRDLGAASIALENQPLTAAERVAIQDLGGERPLIFKGRDDARRAFEKHTARVTELQARLESLGVARDPSALRKAVTQAQRQGELEAQLQSDRESLDRDLRRANDDLRGLEPWSGTLEALEDLRPPQVEVIEQFQDELASAARALDDLNGRIGEGEARAHAIDLQIEQIRLGGEVPTEDDLNQARARREHAWQHLRQAWPAGPDSPEAAAFTRNLAEADELADRLRREADRVATKVKLVTERGSCTRQLAEYQSRLLELRERQDTSHARWHNAWSTLGIAPRTPREMLAWSRRYGELTALTRSIREQQHAMSLREARVVQLAEEIAAALAALDEAPQMPGAPLSDLIERGHAVLEALAETASARKRLEKELASAQSERTELEERATSTARELDRWQGQWRDAMRRLGLPDDATPSQANKVVEQAAMLLDQLDRSRAHRRRIEAIDRDAEKFATSVRAMSERVAPALAKLPVEQAARELHLQLTEGRRVQQRRAALIERRERLEETARNAQSAIREMNGRLAGLCREAQCEREDELPAIERRSERRRKIEDDLAKLNRELSRLVPGEPLDELINEVAAADPDTLIEEIARREAEVVEHDRARESLDQSIGREQEVLSRMDGNGKAADAEQEIEILRTRIRSDVEQYSRLRLASAVLREGIERYRQKRQGPILARAGALFATLTLGSFERLAVEYNDRDEPVLMGVRAGGRTVGVEGMSDGTADQLYLALRLASLENHLSKGEPVPLVVDDILIHFDDERAAAALGVLGELSSRTQILLFTHHRRLVELAESRLTPGTLFTHELPGVGPGR